MISNVTNFSATPAQGLIQSPIEEDLIEVASSLKPPLQVDACGTVKNADGIFVHLPPLVSARLVVRLGNDLAAKQAESEKAHRFMRELLDSVECLTAVAEQHGTRTLADLFYLHSAINSGGFVDFYPDESQLVAIVEALPSAAEWMEHIKTEWLLQDAVDVKPERLFVGVYPCGLVYADRWDESSGDYARLGFLPYDTLKLELQPTCPEEIRLQIEEHAATMQAKKGEQFQISTAGQSVTLGVKA